MALTVTPVQSGSLGNLKYTVATVLWDNSYATGGLALTASTLGFPNAIIGAIPLGAVGSGPTSHVVPSYDTTNSKLQAFGGDGGAAGVVQLKEVANATNLSTLTTRVLFIGN